MERKAAAPTTQPDATRETRRSASPATRERPRVDRLAELRGLIGNRAAEVFLQAKLSTGRPDDPLERQADDIAGQIVATSEPTSATGDSGRQTRTPAPSERLIQPRHENGSGGQFRGDSSPRKITGEGRQLAPSTRDYFEPRFGFDFSHVRIHTGAEANESARSLQATAYTAGSDIVFGAGHFAPETSQGRLLLAHELTHVVQQRASPAPFIQRQVNPLSEPAVVSLGVSLSGMHFTPAATATYPGGKTRYPAMAAILRRLVGPGYRTGLEDEVWREIDALGLSGHGHLAPDSTAKAGDAMVPFNLDIVAANALVSMLENQFKLPTTLAEHQRDLLALGLAGRSAYVELKQFLPDWYSEYIFAREMAQREPLIRAFQKAAAPGSGGDARQQALRDILKSISPGADVLDAIREDFTLARLEPIVGEGRQEKEDRMYAAVQYRVLWGVSEKEGPTLAEPPDGKRIREELAVFFLGFINTQPQLMNEAGGDDGHEARKTLLARFLRFVKRAVTGKTGDEQLLKTPARATDPAWSATLSSAPPLNPPLYDAALETDHRFSMSLDFAHWTDAFQLFSYLWERVRIPEGTGQQSQNIDLEQAAGERPSFGEVYDVRLRRARRYNAADIERISTATGVPFGTAAHDLIGFNNIMRLGGTVVRLALERITRPRHEMQIVFPAPGLYVVRCRAVPILEGHEEVVRAPSIAYQPIVARDPTEMAVTQVQATAQTRFQARLRLAEIQALLQSPFPPPNREELKQEMEILRGMLAEPAEALTRRRDELQTQLDRVNRRVELRKRIALLERQTITPDAREIADLRRQFTELGGPGSAFEDEGLIRSLTKQLDVAKEMVETSEARVKGETGIRETLVASFVSDLGHSISLILEMFDRGTVDGAREVFISDLTTPDSGIGTGRATGKNLTSADVKLAAVKAAMKDLMNTSSDYGRGQVAFNAGGAIHSMRVEAGTGRIFTEALESGVMVVSIAAIAAAPFTGGSSLYILLPLGVVGAIPSAYRLYNRAEASTLRFDLQTAMDVVNIVGGFVGLAHAATPLRLVRLGRVLMIAGIGSDAGGILLMGAGIVEQIDALKGLPEGERAARMLEIIGSAMIQIGIQVGGSIAQMRYQSHAEVRVATGADETPGFHLRREVETPGIEPPTIPPRSPDVKTMAGLGSPGGLPAGRPPGARKPQHPRNSPERLLERLSEGVERKLPPPKPASEVAAPVKAGTYRRGIFSADDAYNFYNEALAISAGREVAVYNNQETGEFCVRVGSEGSVGAPVGEHGWQAVVHYHPNEGNVLTYRLPAPADFGGLIMRYVAEGRAVREFVEFDIPGVGRGRTEFGIEPGDPEPFYVRINLPDGSQRTVRFANDGAYQTYWGERSRYVEPGTAEYRSLLDDVSRYLRDREGIKKAERRKAAAAGEPPTGDTQTAAGLPKRAPGPLQSGLGQLTPDGVSFIRKKFKTVSVDKRSVRLDTLSDERVGEIFNNQPSWLEAIVIAEARGEWLGRKTTTDFLLTDSRSDPLSLHRVGELLEQAATTGSTGHTLNKAILDWSVWDFVREMLRQHDAVLEPAYLLCENHPDRAIRARWERFKLNQSSDAPDLSAFFLGKVGSKRPDVVEVLLSQNEIHITDASFAASDPIHNFKTAFYRTVIERLINVATVTGTDYRAPLRQTPGWAIANSGVTV